VCFQRRQCYLPHSRHLQRVQAVIMSLYRPHPTSLFPPPPNPQKQVLFTSSGTHSIPTVPSLLHSASTSHLPSGTMGRLLSNRWLPVFVGSAGRRLGSAPPLPPPSSHSTKAGISLSSRLLHSSRLHKASDNRRLEALKLIYTIKQRELAMNFFLSFSKLTQSPQFNEINLKTPFDVSRSYTF